MICLKYIFGIYLKPAIGYDGFTMRRLLLFLVFLASCLSAETEMNELSLRRRGRFLETFVLYLPQEEGVKWKRAHQSVHPDASFAVCEYIPKDQEITDWNQMISITYSKDTKHSIPELLEITKDQVFEAHRRSLVKWSVLRANEDEAVYEWSLPQGHYRIPPQVHLVRLVKTNSGIHTLVYSEKGPKLDSGSRQDWLDYFSLGKVKE